MVFNFLISVRRADTAAVAKTTSKGSSKFLPKEPGLGGTGVRYPSKMTEPIFRLTMNAREKN